MKHHIDNEFQDYFEAFETEPSGAVWQGLEHRLIGRKAALAQTRRWKGALVAVGLICLLFVGVLALRNDAPSRQIDKNNQVQNRESIAAQNTAVEELSADIAKKNNLPAHAAGVLPNPNNESGEAKQSNAKTSDFSNNKNIVNLPTGNSPASVQNTPAQLPDSDPLQVTTTQQQPQSASVPDSGQDRIQIEIMAPLEHDPELRQISAPLPDLFPEYTVSTTPGKSPAGRWSIAPWLGYNQYSRNLKNSEQTATDPHTPAFFNQYEKAASNWSAGINLAFDLDRNWRLESGLSLDNFRLNIEQYPLQIVYDSQQASEALLFTAYNTNRIRFELADTIGLEPGKPVPLTGNFRQNLRLLNLPLRIAYTLQRNGLGIRLSAGLTASVLLGESRLKPTGTQPAIKNFEHQFSERSGQLFLGYQGAFHVFYRLDTGHSIFLGPQFSGALTPANQQKQVAFYPQNWGIQLGVEKRL